MKNKIIKILLILVIIVKATERFLIRKHIIKATSFWFKLNMIELFILLMLGIIYAIWSILNEKKDIENGNTIKARVIGITYYRENVGFVLNNRYARGGRNIICFHDDEGKEHIMVEHSGKFRVRGIRYNNYPRYRTDKEIEIILKDKSILDIKPRYYSVYEPEACPNTIIKNENGNDIIVTDSINQYTIIYITKPEIEYKNDNPAILYWDK